LPKISRLPFYQNIKINNKNQLNLMDNFFNNTNLLQIILKWKWHLIILAVVAALVSIVVSSSLFMKPRFKSVAYIYPSNILPYSDESQTEQMLQWINSSDVRDSVIKKFDLAKHYEISTTDKYYASTLESLYNKNVKISKTQYESIEISVTDIDPVMARDILNGILFYTDIKIRNTHYVNYKIVFDAVEKMRNSKLAEMDSVKTLYREIATTYGIYDVGGQSQEITRGELRTVDGGGGNINSIDVKKLKQGMMEKSGDLLYLGNRISHTATEYSEIVHQYELAKYEIDKKVTFINVVTPPKVADKKSYPKRLFVMFYFVAGTLIVSLLAIVILEQRKTFSSELNNH
jgi:capsule polysaccharide export protein KpsE/RkpR